MFAALAGKATVFCFERYFNMNSAGAPTVLDESSKKSPADSRAFETGCQEGSKPISGDNAGTGMGKTLSASAGVFQSCFLVPV